MRAESAVLDSAQARSFSSRFTGKVALVSGAGSGAPVYKKFTIDGDPDYWGAETNDLRRPARVMWRYGGRWINRSIGSP